MKSKYSVLFGSFIFLALFGTCNKKDPLGPQVINYSLFFLIKENGARLSDSVLNDMHLYYYENGVKKYMSDFSRCINEGGFQAHDLGIQATRDAGWISADKNIKTFYLEYPDGSADTLYIDYRHVSYNEAVRNSCYCYYPLQSVKFNGKVPDIDSSVLMYEPVYLFIK